MANMKNHYDGYYDEDYSENYNKNYTKGRKGRKKNKLRLRLPRITFKTKNKSKNKSKKKRSPLAKFLIILGSLLGVFVLVSFAVVFGYAYIMGNRGMTAEQRASVIDAARELNIADYVFDPNLFAGMFQRIPTRTNFLIIGLDDELPRRADTVMVGSFNSDTTELTLISIPRDTWVYPSPELVTAMHNAGRTRFPSNAMRINEISAWAGPVHSPVAMIHQVQEMLGITIQYYIQVTLDAMELIIDLVGGVYYYVPVRMRWWYPEDGHTIDLYPGFQLLSGKQAADLVQFRGYRRADLQRVEVQQDFMREALSQILTRDNVINNIVGFVEIAFNHVETNFPITSFLRYFGYVRNLNADSIRTYTLPLDMQRIGNVVHMDPVQTHYLIQDVFFGANDDLADASGNETDETGEIAQNSDNDEETVSLQGD